MSLEALSQQKKDHLLTNACRDDNLMEVKNLLLNGANVNAREVDLSTPLYWAARNNNLELVQMLIDTKAEINVKSDSGKTPLHYAAIYNSIECLEFLIDKGAKIDEVDHKEKTSLHYAVEQRSLAMVKKLIDKGANKEIKDINKITPLFYAIKTFQPKIATELIEKVADVNADIFEDGLTSLRGAACIREKGLVTKMLKVLEDKLSKDFQHLDEVFSKYTEEMIKVARNPVKCEEVLKALHTEIANGKNTKVASRELKIDIDNSTQAEEATEGVLKYEPVDFSTEPAKEDDNVQLPEGTAEFDLTQAVTIQEEPLLGGLSIYLEDLGL